MVGKVSLGNKNSDGGFLLLLPAFLGCRQTSRLLEKRCECAADLAMRRSGAGGSGEGGCSACAGNLGSALEDHSFMRMTS